MKYRNIVFANPVFPPEILPGGVMCYNLVRELVSRNYALTVLTGFPNRPEGVVFPGFKRKIRQVSTVDGFRLIRCWTWLIGERRGAVNRLLENISFGFIAAVNLLLLKDVDLIVIDAWPCFCTFMITVAARMKGIPSYYYVQDLLPEQAENTGMIEKGGVLSNIFLWIDKKACSYATGILALSATMIEHIVISRNAPSNKCMIAPVQVDVNAIYPVGRLNSWRDSHGIAPDKFVVMYTGTLGHVSGISILNEIVPLFTEEDKVLFICIGEGPLKSQLEDTAQKYPHLILLPYQPESDYLLALGTADIALLTMDSSCGVASVPSKMYTYMAAEKPVLTNAPLDSENAKLINTTGCGILVSPDNPAELGGVIKSILKSPDLILDMGKAGRRYIVENCTVDKVADKIEDLWRRTTSI
jgi:glycosyltransferase involved in cell wall biosynthesis